MHSGGAAVREEVGSAFDAACVLRIKTALAETIADHPPPLVIVVPTAWRAVIEANPSWYAGVTVMYDDDILNL
jgi:hypothetical protein